MLLNGIVDVKTVDNLATRTMPLRLTFLSHTSGMRYCTTLKSTERQLVNITKKSASTSKTTIRTTRELVARTSK